MTTTNALLLIHGSFCDAEIWRPVADRLRDRGYEVFVPTVAGHGPDGDRSVSHDDCVASLIDYVDTHCPKRFVALAHSWGGTLLQKLAELRGDRLERMVFHNAFVLRDGESLYDVLPPGHQALWDTIKDDPNGLVLPFSVFRDVFANDVDLETAQAAYSHVSPTPVRSHLDKVSLPTFEQLEIPRSWLYAWDDVALTPGDFGWHPRMSQRLGLYRMVSMPGGHMVCQSTPDALTEAIILATRP
ncbi:alpha/beta fold hydrolase [Larsenimonas suaedae]|uniref:Alpha/beta hydrolase n=1 Tax=Larsenimonas suaedae TaxID=1851019 RepID=A0ABU1GT88_9GAMM|nr:alpha/beta hydrolase [Larsenimonas suaedae]MCM2972418.1 alpha/beta hydrolase [Larsenimonas suaedae]MDR5894786.1 alpha/beta hydrolase [Larsenimonas suaedae]